MRIRGLGLTTCLIAGAAAAHGPGAAAQTRQRGPWWPHPIWGATDQAGASNWITAETVLRAIRLVRTGKIYELGHIYDKDVPLGLGRSYTLVIPSSPTYGPWGRHQLVVHDDLLIATIGQVGTQFDGLGHVGARMKMADGSTTDVFYNGFTLDELRDPYGLKNLGIERVKPILTRGILIDIAGLKGLETLPPSYEVTVADARAALARESIAEASLQAGDALFFNYGVSKGWGKPGRAGAGGGGPPGIGLEVAKWIIERQASMVGSDAGGTEVGPNPDSTLSFPVHQELITKNGIFNLESMTFEELVTDRVYEFLFIFTPVRFRGATGSPGRPIAIR